MEKLKLDYPVQTIEGKLLLPVETRLSAETLEILIASNRGIAYETCPLLSYGTVKRQILHLIDKPPYNVIFSDETTIAEIMAMMETARLPVPVLQSLDYFKEHDYHTYCHSLMVFVLSTLLAKELMPDKNDWIQETTAGPTHDIGKTCVPLKVLKKTTPLTRRERSMLDHHTAAGYVLLTYFHKDPKNLAAVVARDHHERKDGSGKPRGIHLRDRMVEIIVVCDVYDALISPRPYRPVSYDNRTALEEITRMAENKQIGWEVAKALVSFNRKKKPSYSETDVSLEKRGTPPAVNFYGVIADDPDE
jgi:HD-GYP domain-containing protein (c-di-GMP phosphodiesterase class II)